jgi:caffeoyl-CoA O-methyltransferase
MQFISKDLEAYCLKYSKRDTDLLNELSKTTWETEESPQMISGALVGGMLQMLIKISGANKILEIGMFTGYSALKMAEALPENGKIHCCELMEKHVETANNWFKKSNLDHKVNIHQGEAKDTLEQFNDGSFDMIFIDADKVNYPLYYHKSTSLLKTGGIAVFDNMLWSGTVLDPSDQDSLALRETAELIINNNRLEPLLLPVRDGIMIYRKL